MIYLAKIRKIRKNIFESFIEINTSFSFISARLIDHTNSHIHHRSENILRIIKFSYLTIARTHSLNIPLPLLTNFSKLFHSYLLFFNCYCYLFIRFNLSLHRVSNHFGRFSIQCFFGSLNFVTTPN
jgi:hypothetical protein